MYDDKCRLCEGHLRRHFDKKVLGDIEATYYLCMNCFTLQLPNPFWLKRAYETKIECADPDVGRLKRALIFQRIIRRLIYTGIIKNSSRILDEGAGLGILVRLLRDDGRDAWGRDPFSKPVFAEQYINEDFPEGSFDLICAAEVIEHSTNPVGFLESLVSRLNEGGVILLSTELFDESKIPVSIDWPYIAAEWGQHVTFLSPKGLSHISTLLNLNWIVSLSFAGNNCIHVLAPKSLGIIKLLLFKTSHRIGEFFQRYRLLV